MSEEITREEVEARIKDIVVDLLGVDEEEVVPEARFREDLEADSLDLVELIMAFEDEFGGQIPDEEAQSITTVGEGIDYVMEQLDRRAAEESEEG